MSRKITLHDPVSGKDYSANLPCILGRGKEADVSFCDLTISHKHAVITETDDGRIWIEDLKSANGVYLNDKRIEYQSALNTGDSIRIGNTKLVVSGSEEDISLQTVILHSLRPAEERSLDHERLKTIYEITGELTSNHDMKSFGQRIFAKLKEAFMHDRAYLATFEPDGSLKPVYLDSIDESAPLSRSIINRLLQTGESLLLEDALSDVSFKEQESIMALKVRSALCAPLIYHNQIYGLIYLDRNVPGAYKHDDLEFLRSIGSILAPIIENARLWIELKKRYANTVETLKSTEARLIESERTAAFVRLAHAMAHEIRNPMMVIGGLVKKLARTETDITHDGPFSAIMSSVDRVEKVLREVDSFVRIPEPRKELYRIDNLVREEIEGHDEEWRRKSVRPSLSVNTPHVLVPIDPGLIRKAVSMVLKEIIFSLPDGAAFSISVSEKGNDIDISFGSVDKDARLAEPFDPELNSRPWSTSLFLNMAHKILTDHGGKLLLDPKSFTASPVVMRLPLTEKI